MQQFIPFEDDWDLLAHLPPERLVPYRSGLVQRCLLPSSPTAGAGEEDHSPSRIEPNQSLTNRLCTDREIFEKAPKKSLL
ncbi:MAG: hypothetical protein ABW154_09410 [Dyella sp.]